MTKTMRWPIRHPVIASQRTAVVLGTLLVIGGFVVLYDAWEGRGDHKPWMLGPILPW